MLGTKATLTELRTTGRLLFFDNPERPFANPVAALAHIGLEIAVADDDVVPTARDVIAVVCQSAETHDQTRVERIIRSLRENNDIPVLVLAATGDDDLLLQEFRPGASGRCRRTVALDFAERVRSSVRRSASPLMFGSLSIDTYRRIVSVAGVEVDLTPREFELLAFLAYSPHRAFTRGELLSAVWRSSSEWQTPATVTEHVGRLRHKLDAAGQDGVELTTVRGFGYRLEPRQHNAGIG